MRLFNSIDSDSGQSSSLETPQHTVSVRIAESILTSGLELQTPLRLGEIRSALLIYGHVVCEIVLRIGINPLTIMASYASV